MKKPFVLLFLSLVVLLSTAVGWAQERDEDEEKRIPQPRLMNPEQQPPGVKYDCPYQKGFQRAQRVGSYTVRLLPGRKKGDDRCHATVTSPSGKSTTVASEWALTVDKVSGADINGDGKPELVLDGYAGEVHCCYTYTIVSLGSTPRVLRNFNNRLPVFFQTQADGTTLIHAGDSVFDFFLLPHSESVIPQLVLKMEGEKLVDVSAQFSKEYDTQIEQARSQLNSADVEKFRQSRFGDKLFTDQMPTVRRVLVIVLNYLYSGREDKAWQALDEFWPPSDEARIKTLIIERRSRGLLKQVADEKAEAMQPTDKAKSR